MFKKSVLATGMVTSLLCSTNALCNPASTEYVKTAIDALRTELSSSSSANDSKIDAVQKQVNDLPIITHQIGEVVQGGIVFYVDASRQHGLMASLHDLEPDGIEWRNGEGGDRTVNAKGLGLGSGEPNTRMIVAQQTIDQQEGQFAALLAANYHCLADGAPCSSSTNPTLSCYGGWFLPSVDELILMHANLKTRNLAQLADVEYWSSTEANTTQAWLVHFATGEAQAREKLTPARVRAIHTF